MAKVNHADELVALDPIALDTTTSGEEFQGRDYYMLTFLGLLLPVALLVWGWL